MKERDKIVKDKLYILVHY